MTNQEWEQIEKEFRESNIVWASEQQRLIWFKQRLVVDVPNPLISVTECKNYEPKHEDNKLCKWCGKGKYTHV